MGQQSFSVSSFPIRVSHSSFGLHQNCSSCLSSSAHTIYPDSFLPGRFSCQGTQPRHSFVSYPDSYRPPPRTRFPDFLEEIGGHSVSGFRFPRRTFQDGLGSCVSSRGEIFGSSSVYSNLSGQDLSHCSSIFTTARASQLSSRCSTVRTSTIRPLQFYLLEHWTPSSQDWEASIPILEVLSPHLSWWLQRENVMTGFPLASPVPSLTLFTDASLLGWGAYLEGQTISGMWSSTLQKDHINLLEMRAVLLALSHFMLCLESISIVLATDNTTVVAYLKNQGGTHCYSLYQLAKDVLILCSQFQIHLVVRHIPGRLNVLADSLSRSLAPVNTEWELHQAVFQSIVLHWGNPNIDLFATSLNFKVTTFVSPVPDPRAYAVAAMSLSWEGMFAYAFPPFRFLAPVLHKITGEKCRIIVIAPAWPKQAWFANLLRLSCARPLVLPLKRNLLSQFKGGVVHLSPERLHLHAWFLSGIISDRKAFLKQLPSTSPGQCENQLASSMMQSGQSSLIGVLEGRLIHSKSISGFSCLPI